ncbi:MAG TPA: ATP-binding protein [Vicinamibacterales bacterium]
MSPATMTVAHESAAQAWPERNQRWLSQRFTVWRERLDNHRCGGGEPIGAPPFDDPTDFQPAALQVRAIFGLTTFETELLVLAAGIEIDSALRAAVAQAKGRSPLEAVQPTFSLALALLPEPHWDALSPLGALRHWSLVDFDFGAGLAHASLRIDERVLHYLTGVAAFDERLNGFAYLDDGPAEAEPDDITLDIAMAIGGTGAALVMLPNATAEPSRKRAGRVLARAAFQRAGLQTLWTDLSAAGGEPREVVELAHRLDREAALTPAGIALALDPAAHAGSAARLIAALRSPVITLGALSSLELADLPDRRVWRFNVPHSGRPANRDLPSAVRRASDRALQQFHVDEAVLDQALASTADLDDDATIEERVWDALRESARGGLDTLAQRIDCRTTFDDLVVPPLVEAQLREIASQLGQRRRVYDEWGFGDRHRRGLGIAALFAGESGTGKTLAAEAIANAARLDLYRIDLASVVSKYIGETEKNLSRVFDAAERSGAVLLFDEADALFGKRSEVKDSHDRYANIEVAYLLQRVETYRGLAVLTTNMKNTIDRAFLRRIRFIVQFPFPDEAAREQIWRLQFPARAPLGGIDYAMLARLQLSGGHIRSVALNAAFHAAGRGKPIEQSDLLAAARAEFAKLERTFNVPAGGPV